MKVLLIVFLFFGSMINHTEPVLDSEIIQISMVLENNDPCGCIADMQECIQNNPPGSGCLQEYKYCTLTCGC